jgi:16S rRNA (guanine966-N2)-methyltransferase
MCRPPKKILQLNQALKPHNVRITGGKFKGRKIEAPKTQDTRPMTDKVRSALFNILGPVDGLNILDAYAGSGAVGFEALSRGARSVIAVERGKEACTAITLNQKNLDVEKHYSLFSGDIKKWIKGPNENTYNIIFAMPPYASFDHSIVEALGSKLSDNGVMIIEYSKRAEILDLAGLAIIMQRNYGDATLVFYRSVK